MLEREKRMSSFWPDVKEKRETGPSTGSASRRCRTLRTGHRET